MKKLLLIVKAKKRNGFSLIEVLVAIFLFSLSLFALIPLMSTAVSIDRENFLNIKSRAMASDVLDALMGNVPPPYGNPSTVIDGGVAITRAWNVTQLGNLDHISVTVQYTYNGQQKTFVLTAQKER